VVGVWDYHRGKPKHKGKGKNLKEITVKLSEFWRFDCNWN